MKKFYFTFGQKYRRELHPLGIHPDGWVAIMADTETDAVAHMFRLCGEQWANVYDTEPDMEFYPRGELRCYS